MNELIAMYALNYVIEKTTDGRSKALSLLTDADIELFADWAEKQTDTEEDIFNSVLEIIVNKVKELKGE